MVVDPASIRTNAGSMCPRHPLVIEDSLASNLFSGNCARIDPTTTERRTKFVFQWLDRPADCDRIIMLDALSMTR